MKAVIWTAYGPPEVLQLQEIEKPAPRDNEVLIKVHAATVTAGDCEMRSLKFPLFLSLPMRLFAGPLRPTRVRIIGQELAGEVEAAGKEVTRFKPGDQVFGALGFGKGAYAEYICLPEEAEDDVLAIKPANLTYEEAAALPVGGMEALHYLRQGKIQPGHKVLINGAGGSIGTMGVQLAKHHGAEVTGVDSTAKLDMLRSLGADHVMDYTQEDLTKAGRKYDVVFDVVGKIPIKQGLGLLEPDGRYLVANPGLSHLFRGRWTSATTGKKVVMGYASSRLEDLLFLKELVEAGEVKPVIDRSYPLEQTAEAHRYVETGQKKGNVAITVAG